MKIVIAITGASGSIYAQRLLECLNSETHHDLSIVLSKNAKDIIKQELPDGIKIPAKANLFSDDDLLAPFASGSNPPDSMVIIPCSMGTLGRIAHGLSDTLILRTADVVLKERKKLILVPRESPLNIIHLENMLILARAGAVILPACPAFYNQPKSIIELIDTTISRVLDHIGITNNLVIRWQNHPPAQQK